MSSGNGLPFNGALAQIPGAPPQAPYPLTIPCSTLPPLPEDRFKALLSQLTNSTGGLGLNDDGDFVIDGQAVNPWVLHRAVFARNGFDSVTANDEWPAVGAALGFPPISTDQPGCAPAIARRLQRLYNDSLLLFEKAYINNALVRLQAAQPS